MFIKFSTRLKQSGVSLVELIMFIVIISFAISGILLVMNQVTGHSADTLIRKQSLAIAESLLEEIELMPFTFCDPNDVNAASANSATDCTAGLSQDVITAATPNTETRYDAVTPYNNVADYAGFPVMSPIRDITNTIIANLGNYSATVKIYRAGVTMLGLGAGNDGAALRIEVSVTGPDNIPVKLDGYRTRYAPRDVP